MLVKVKDIVAIARALITIADDDGIYYGYGDEIELAEKIVNNSTNEYEQGWHDALEMALKETSSYHTEDGTFRCVQEETLIGLGMSHQESIMNLEREVNI